MQRLNKFDRPSFEAYRGQTVLSASLRVTSRLEKEVPHRYKPFPRYRPFSGEHHTTSPESSTVLQLLNWIAMFLAHSSHDSTAAAITEERDKSLCIHLSINKDKLEDSDRRRAVSMIYCIYQAITDQAQRNTSSQQQKTDLYNNLTLSIINNCWPMISHRMDQLKVSIRNAGVVESLIGLWPPGYKNEGSWGTDAAAAGSPPIDQLRKQLETLSTIPDQKFIEGTEDLRLQCLTTALHACEILVNQNYVPRADNVKWYAELDDSTYRKLDELFRHVLSVYDYRSLTMEFISAGVKLLCNHIGIPDNEQIFGKKLSVVWFRDTLKLSLKSACHWELSPEQWLSRLLIAYSVPGSTMCKPKSEIQKTTFLHHCADFWSAGDAVSALVHPEIELLYYLVQLGEERTLVCDAIGTDSELCFACDLYFDKVDEHADMKWLRRSGTGSLNKVQDNWLLPPVNNAHCVGQLQWAQHAAVQTSAIILHRAARCIDAYLNIN